jgi:hypothetical protein
VEGNGCHTEARKLACAPAASIIKTMVLGLAQSRECFSAPHIDEAPAPEFMCSHLIRDRDDFIELEPAALHLCERYKPWTAKVKPLPKKTPKNKRRPSR